MELRKAALVGHSAESMFDLIEAAEAYPAFLPWCAAASILARSDTEVVATLAVDYHGLRFEFTTRNPKRRPEWMAISLDRGPFRRFEGEWRLTRLGLAACRIEFALRYEFSALLVRTLAGPVFDRIASTFVDAFVARANATFAAHPGTPDNRAPHPAAGGDQNDR